MDLKGSCCPRHLPLSDLSPCFLQSLLLGLGLNHHSKQGSCWAYSLFIMTERIFFFCTQDAKGNHFIWGLLAIAVVVLRCCRVWMKMLRCRSEKKLTKLNEGIRAVTVAVTTASPAVVCCHRGCVLSPAVVYVMSHTHYSKHNTKLCKQV